MLRAHNLLPIKRTRFYGIFWLYFFIALFYDASMSRNDMSNSELNLSDISAVMCRIADVPQMQAFLGEILTPSEQRDLALRWELMRRLKQGESQRKIAKDLGISLCKITRGAKILKQEHSVSQHFLKAGEKDESKDLT